MAFLNGARRLFSRLGRVLGRLCRRDEKHLLIYSDDLDFELLFNEQHLERCLRRRSARPHRGLHQDQGREPGNGQSSQG